MLTLSLLIDCPQHLPQIATWIFDEWGHLTQGLTLDKVETHLQNHLNRDAIPLTLVAIKDHIPVGTASLMLNDLSSRPDLSPWLASVYVQAKYRKQGIGSQLVSAAEETGQRLGVQKLYLFTPDQERFYARLGWSVYDQAEYRGEHVVIMSKLL
jgi:N-acetylglutamate synthase-like GNAT family acetyltransferase